MNKFIIIFVVSFLCADINLYWDLGVGITNFSVKNSQDNLITLSTFNRIEGLKNIITKILREPFIIFHN